MDAYSINHQSLYRLKDAIKKIGDQDQDLYMRFVNASDHCGNVNNIFLRISPIGDHTSSGDYPISTLIDLFDAERKIKIHEKENI